MARIGIPSALYYYTDGKLWETFFSSLGHTVITSGTTDKAILDAGVRMSTDQTCLPVKVFFGHAAKLCAYVDAIFIPRLVSVEKDKYICPKFMGLPDMIKANIPNLPQIIAPDIEGFTGRDVMSGALISAAQQLGSTRREAAESYDFAVRAFGKTEPQAELRARNFSVGVLGHPYLIYDNYINMSLLKTLLELNLNPITFEMLGELRLHNGMSGLRRPIFWSYGSRVVGAARYLLKHRIVDGIIHVSSFGCGPDSFTGQLIADECSKAGGIPMLNLTLDEHTGEAGIITRVEAYSDMLARRGTA